MSPSVSYRQLVPPPELMPHVRCIWHLSGFGAANAPPERIIPDGCVEMVINLGDPFLRHVAGRAVLRQPSRIVAAVSRAITVAPTGRMDVWGVRFHPWSAAGFLGVSAAELCDEVPELASASGSLDRTLEHLGEIGENRSRYDALVGALRARVAEIPPPSRQLVALVQLASELRETPSVRSVARHTCVSVRRVQAVFRDRVGLTPKQLMRITRLQRALQIARSLPASTWSSVAASAGYYDHSHLLHDAQKIAGVTPAAILRGNAALTEAFLSS